jgi:large subunit ribosomal protein L49
MKDVKITTTSGFVPRSGDISPDLPFAVARSTHGQLPVYSRTANGGTRRSTIVRRISGDVDKLAHDLMVVTGENEIRLRYGSIEIKGNHTKTVQQYLLGQGF